MQYPVLNTNSIEANISETKAKIPLLIKGNWHVPGYGLMRVTDNYIEKLKDNYKSNVLGFKPYATLGHPTDSPDPASIDGERKRGDLEDIIVENDIVYGVYDINLETYNLIKNGDYEYSSPEIQQNFKDKVTGESKGPTLLRTALTNAPFMPFNDNKIVALSQSNNTNDEEIISPICIKLSTTISVNTQTIEPTIETKTEQEYIKMSTTPIEVTSPSVSTSPEVKQSVDIEAILTKVLSTQAETFTNTLNSLTTKFDESVNNVISQTSETVAVLTREVQSMKSQVSDVLTKANEFDKTAQYVTSLSSSDKARQLNSKLKGLFDSGVTPAAISLTKKLIENEGNSVVKLSINGAETDVSFEDSLIELVKLSSTSFQDEFQVGAQSTPVKANYINQVIEANRAKAESGKIKK
jgi:hypothetical protein